MPALRRHGLGRAALILPAATCVVLLFGGLAVAVAMGGMMPLPYGPAADVQAYARAHPDAVKIAATSVFASSVPLAVYVATVVTRLRHLGVRGPIVTVALVGGTLATGALALAGLLGWTVAQPEVAADGALVRAFYFLVFLVGGPGHVVALGLLVGGIALPGLVSGLLPKPFARAGVVVAVLAECTALVLAWTLLGPLLPLARVSALAWLLAAGALLPRVHLERSHCEIGLTGLR